MTKNKKIIAIQVIASIAMMFLVNSAAYASEVTGTLSSSSSSSSSQAGGTVGGSVGGGSSVSGTLGGGSSGNGSTISGTITSGGGGGGSGGSSLSGSISSGGGSSTSSINQNNTSGLLAFTNQGLTFTPGLPNTGFGPDGHTTTLWNFSLLYLGLFATFIASNIMVRKS